MKSKSVFITFVCLAAFVSISAYKKEFSPGDGAPPSPQVVPTGDMSLVTVDKPDQFPLIAAERAEGSAELKVTGRIWPLRRYW